MSRRVAGVCTARVWGRWWGEWVGAPGGAPLLHLVILGWCLRRLAACVQKFIRQPGVPVETACRVYRRYLKLEPEHAEEYITYLKAQVSPAQGCLSRLLQGCSHGAQPGAR